MVTNRDKTIFLKVIVLHYRYMESIGLDVLMQPLHRFYRCLGGTCPQLAKGYGHLAKGLNSMYGFLLQRKKWTAFAVCSCSQSDARINHEDFSWSIHEILVDRIKLLVKVPLIQRTSSINISHVDIAMRVQQ
jgi:hypothetical protein